MIRNTKVLKALALFFTANILFNVLLPLLNIGLAKAYAKAEQVQQGLTPPNIVDLKSGDMNYSVPFISLPGAHSFDLSYRAGISPTENASWIGLGWYMEAGEISRSINGYPDDYAGEGSYEFFYKGSLTGITETNTSSYNVNINGNYYPFGCLKGKDMTNGLSQGNAIDDSYVFDTYTSHFPDFFQTLVYRVDGTTQTPPAQYNRVVLNENDTYYGGSFPNYDGYFVSGGNMSGNIQPLILENPTLYHMSRESSLTDRTSYVYKPFSQAKPCFRFINDFSNSYKTSNVNAFGFDGSYTNFTYSLGSNGLGYDHNAGGTSGFNSTDMKLAGSKHVEYYTNAEIVDATSSGAKSKGFIGYEGMPNTASARCTLSLAGSTYYVTNQVGGYSITDANGSTYHYALPVYTYKRFSYSKTVDGIETVTDIAQPFAGKWLLTSITGPDYVDKNSDGYANEGDWGNWTSFVYGKWTDDYNERSPLTGNYITSNGSESYNSFKRQAYYLDAAYTRTHAVLFPKSSRSDANGALRGGTSVGTSLKLNSGLLFTIDGIKTIRSQRSYSSTSIYGDINSIKGEYSTSGYGAVLDATDLQNISTAYSGYTALIAQESRLTQDYSLCSGSPNSTGNTGKLTLNSVSYYGRNGSQTTPNYDFTYELAVPNTFNVQMTFSPVAMGTRKGRLDFSSTPNPFKAGDIVKFTISSVTYYASLVKGITYYGIPNALYDVVFLGPNIPGDSQRFTTVTATETKNPPYTEGYYDVWGSFKSDFDYSGNLQNKGRKTSAVSAVGVDVWSLRKISTPTGATIEPEYESDTYSNNAASVGKRVLNVDPMIGFKPTTAYQSSYSSLTNDGTYYQGLNFTMSHLDRTATYHDFKLYFLEPDAWEAIDNNIIVSQNVKMVSLCNFYNSGAGSNTTFTESADVQVQSKGSQSDPYIIVRIPRNDQSQGLPFVDPTSTSYTHCVHLGSHLIIGNQKMISYGGGVRVKSVSLKGNGETFKTTYDYNNKAFANTSGSVSYDPNQYDIIDIVAAQAASGYPYTLSGSTTSIVPYEQANNYKSIYALFLNNFESIRYFVPAPGVQYEYITVKNYGNDIQENTYQEYQYEVFKNSFIKREVPFGESTCVIDYTTATKTHVYKYAVHTDFKDLSSKAGNILSIKTYDLLDKIISKQVFNYSDETTLPNNQGVVGEVFNEERYGEYVKTTGTYMMVNVGAATIPIDPQCDECIGTTGYPAIMMPVYVTTGTESTDRYYYGIVSSFNRYPTVLLSTETTDYLKGTSEKVVYKAYDFYNGSATEIVSKDSYGNAFKTKVTPFYKHTWSGGGVLPACSLGLKMNGGNNMIAEPAEINVYKVSPSNYNTDLATMSSKVMLWSNGLKYRQCSSGLYQDVTVTEDAGTVQSELICRPASVYVWNSPKLNSDGSYNSFAAFNPASINANWKLASENKLTNPYSGMLSSADINSNYSSQKLTKKKSMLLAEADNANYSSFTYTGFEDFDEGTPGVSAGFIDGELTGGFYNSGTNTFDARTSSSAAHTGNYICKATSGYPVQHFTKTISGDAGSLQPGRTYRASVWIDESSASTAAITVNVNGSRSGTAYNADYSAGISQAVAKCGTWYLVYLDFDIPSDYVSSSGIGANRVTVSLSTSSGTAYFDDFSFHPLDADVTGYVYDALTWQLNYTLDKDNFYSRYEYDNNNRLKAIYRETVNGEVKLKDYKYNIVK
jgi:hypothetical protein